MHLSDTLFVGDQNLVNTPDVLTWSVCAFSWVPIRLPCKDGNEIAW